MEEVMDDHDDDKTAMLKRKVAWCTGYKVFDLCASALRFNSYYKAQNLVYIATCSITASDLWARSSG